MNRPLISIVTPSYNQGHFIRRTIDSVLSQSGDFDLEYQVFDGGSTDETVDVLRSYGARLAWVSRPDRGQVDAINQGLSQVRGGIVGWLNSDDTLAPGALQRVAEAFSRHPYANWVHGRCEVIDEADLPIRRWISAYKNHQARRHSLERLLVVNYVSQMTAFWRAEAQHEVGLLDESLKLAFDYDLWLRLALRGPPVFIDRHLANFRWYESTKSGANFQRQFDEDMAVAARYTDDPRLLARKARSRRKIVVAYEMMRRFRGVARTIGAFRA